MADRSSGNFPGMQPGRPLMNVQNIVPNVSAFPAEYVGVPSTQYIVPNVQYSTPYQVPAYQVPAPVPSSVGTVPAGIPQTYGPWFAGQTYVQGFPNIPVHRDEAEKNKWIEQQKKLMKERTFQAQQQKLKQFNVSSAKSDISSKTLIENMFGKSHDKQTKSANNAALKKGIPGKEQPASAPQLQPKSQFQTTPEPETKASDKKSSVTIPAQDPKFLENMMLECSDLKARPKAKTFQKPVVHQIKPTKQTSVQFAASQKARDWQNVKIDELGEMFTIKRPRFPLWCCTEKVPPLYHMVEEQATEKGVHPIDTSILYPILISSLLPRDVLGRIWEMVNQTTPGQLTSEELYAALALIAVAQAGHAVPNVDILHMLSHPPIPVLQAFLPSTPPIQTPIGTPDSIPPVPAQVFVPVYSFPTPGPGLLADANLNSPINVTTPVGMENAAVVSAAQLFSVASQEPSGTFPAVSQSDASFPAKPTNEGVDDEFDDFKCAVVPSSENVAIPKSESHIASDDDFTDFKQADASALHSSVASGVQHPSMSVTRENKIGSDLMATEEDKYSIFRMIQPDSTEAGWSIVGSEQKTSNADKSEVASPEQVLCTEMISCTTNEVSGVINALSGVEFVTSNMISEQSVTETSKENPDDDFGDFLCATNAAYVSVTVSQPCVPFSQSQNETIECNFANFEQFQTETEEQFGNFASFDANFVNSEMTIDSDVPTVIHVIEDFDNLSLNQGSAFQTDSSTDGAIQGSSKDNLSSAESQSISSLELAGYDTTPGNAGESKSSISRHGSVPSLDLKMAGTEGNDTDETFGDMLSAPFPSFGGRFGKQLSVSACSSPDISRMRENSSPLPLTSIVPPVSATILLDRYSSIRPPSQEEDSDRHISEWMRCLRSCFDLFETANKIFSEISNTTVCTEVLSTSEGSDYVKNLVEVYRVVCRISSSAESVGKKTDKLKSLLKDIECAWKNLGSYVNSTLPLIPSKSSDAESDEAKFASENSDACGICLLSVEQSYAGTNDTFKLFYGGRHYHTTCANLWVNCVEPLLPSLPLPQLL